MVLTGAAILFETLNGHKLPLRDQRGGGGGVCVLFPLSNKKQNVFEYINTIACGFRRARFLRRDMCDIDTLYSTTNSSGGGGEQSSFLT